MSNGEPVEVGDPRDLPAGQQQVLQRKSATALGEGNDIDWRDDESISIVEGGVSVVQAWEELVVSASVRASESGALEAGSVVDRGRTCSWPEAADRG